MLDRMPSVRIVLYGGPEERQRNIELQAIAPDRVVRNMPARLNDSFHASEREASRLQCSVDRICSRIAGEVPLVGALSPRRGAGEGSALMPLALRSNYIVACTD